MMKRLLVGITIMSVIILTSCLEEVNTRTDYIDFEDLELPVEGYWNGSDESGGFFSGNAFFINDYDTAWQSWSGFSYTNHSDVLTAGYANQYSAIPGSGDNLSDNYAVFYFDGTPDTLLFYDPARISNISIANSTYAYMAMKYGDDFSKKFGGQTGDDPDYLMLKLTCLNQNFSPVGYAELFLANFTEKDNSLDYILDTWVYANLQSLGYLQAIIFEMESSDTVNLGMNTPAYVCIDNIIGEIIVED